MSPSTAKWEEVSSRHLSQLKICLRRTRNRRKNIEIMEENAFSDSWKKITWEQFLTQQGRLAGGDRPMIQVRNIFYGK